MSGNSGMLSFGSGASTDGRGSAIGITVGSGTSGDGGIDSLLLETVPRRQKCVGSTGEGTTTSSGTSILSRQMQAQAELAAVSYSLREHRVLATQVAYSWKYSAAQTVRKGPCG